MRIGDRAIIRGTGHSINHYLQIGSTAVCTGVRSDCFEMNGPGDDSTGRDISQVVSPADLEWIISSTNPTKGTKERIMNSISNLSAWAKRKLDPKAKTLYEAGYTDEHGVPTEKGREVLMVLAWNAAEDQLVAQAQAELDAEKKSA